MDITKEQVARMYTSSLDSVTLINDLAPKANKSAEELDRIKRNGQHLQIVLSKGFWTTEDLTPLTAAVATAQAVVDLGPAPEQEAPYVVS